MQADDGEIGIKDRFANLPPAVGSEVGDHRREGERRNFEAVVSQGADGPTHVMQVPSFEQFVADSQANHDESSIRQRFASERAAWRVLRSNMATVNGPTPPGNGREKRGDFKRFGVSDVSA